MQAIAEPQHFHDDVKAVGIESVAVNVLRDGDIAVSVERGQEVKSLKHKTDFVAAEFGAVRIAHFTEIVAAYQNYHGSNFFTFESIKNILNGGDAYGLGAEMLNFGALIAFMGVNFAAFLRYFVRSNEKTAGNLIPPVLGFLICFGLWINLSRPAIIVGSIWMAAGIAFGVWKTRGFREQLSFELPPEE